MALEATADERLTVYNELHSLNMSAEKEDTDKQGHTIDAMPDTECPITAADIDAVMHATAWLHASTMKTRIHPAKVLDYLRDNVDPSIARLTPVAGGEISQAFSFEHGGRSFIVRVNRDDDSFVKDAYAAAHFSSERLPVPEVVHIGKMADDYHVCISRKAEGKALDSQTEEQTQRLLPKVMEMLDAIHETPVTEEGFGYFGADGKGKYASWQEDLLSIEHADWIDWEQAFGTTCLEPDSIASLLTKLKMLAPRMPSERALVHGDVGMDNVLADGEKITAVIDWGGARYGDPLYDVAWLHVWWETVPFADLYRRHCAEKKRPMPDYELRIQCYATCIGIGALAFFALSHQPQKYAWLKGRLQEIGVL